MGTGQRSAARAALIVIVLILWLALLLANPIRSLIGAAGANVLARVMGLILAAVAVGNAPRGVAEFFRLGAG